eukprot:11349888-Ditylum_brightwellii.AAC.1
MSGSKGLNLLKARGNVQTCADRYNVEKHKCPSYEGGKETSNTCVCIYHRELTQHPYIGITKDVAKKPTIPAKHPAKNHGGTDGAKKLVTLIKKAV